MSNAFDDTTHTLDDIRRALGDVPLRTMMVPADAVSLTDAVSTYLFNSQLLSLDELTTLLGLGSLSAFQQ